MSALNDELYTLFKLVINGAVSLAQGLEQARQLPAQFDFDKPCTTIPTTPFRRARFDAFTELL